MTLRLLKSLSDSHLYKRETNIPPLEKGDKGGFKNVYFVLELKNQKSSLFF